MNDKPAKTINVTLDEREYKALFQVMTYDHLGPQQVPMKFKNYAHDILIAYVSWRQEMAKYGLEEVDITEVFAFLSIRDNKQLLYDYLSKDKIKSEAA